MTYRKQGSLWVPRRSLRDCRGFIAPALLGAIAAGRRRSAGGGTSPGTTGLIAWYNFADAKDADGETYNLTEIGSPGYTSGPPSYGTAEDGNPGKHWEQATLDNNFANTAGSWSFVFRFRGLTGLASGDNVMNGNGGRTVVTYHSTSLRGVVGGVSISSTVAPSLNTWYTLLFVWDNAAGIAKISVNGSTFETTGGTQNTSVGTFFIGANSATNGQPCDIDFAAFWNAALTQDNATWLYNSGGTRTYAEL